MVFLWDVTKDAMTAEKLVKRMERLKDLLMVKKSGCLMASC
jgi:hypothetical protein